jgi:tRNA-uridine 2-sulfurtransferase
MPAQRVVVAMSGGVDSSLTANILQQAGYDVHGAHMQFYPPGNPPPGASETLADLEMTCRMLGIPLHVFNFEKEFQEQIVTYFLGEYSRGRTPNPCVFCNKDIKFGLLLEKAREMGADFLASGHYARIENHGGEYRLLKAVDMGKDQTYFLFTLGQGQLKQVLFPLGGLYKTEVRQRAAALNLPASKRRESEDLCFVRGKDYRPFLEGRISLQTGEIVDAQGRVFGRHNGLAAYTIGQRHGLGLSAAEPLFVTALDTARNRLVVGKREELFSCQLIATDLNWVSGSAPADTAGLKARIRYRSPEVEVKISLTDVTARVTFTRPQWAVAPGQTIVFYQGDIVLGGGIIQEEIKTDG